MNLDEAKAKIQMLEKHIAELSAPATQARSAEKLAQVIQLRAGGGGGKTFPEIGQAMGIPTYRAHAWFNHAYYKAKQKPQWTDGLPTRAINILALKQIKSLEELQALFYSDGLHQYSLCGKVTIKQISDWLIEKQNELAAERYFEIIESAKDLV